MRAATSLPLHLLLAFAAAGLTTLTSCGEKQTTTIGGENTDAASTSLDSDTSASSDSLGKRLGVAMPSTAVNFTQIPARNPNAADIAAFSGSRDGSILAVRTPDSILILNGSDLATTSEIPADFLEDSSGRTPLILAGRDFVFDLQRVSANNLGGLKWMMDAYRITPGHANYGKREIRALLTLSLSDSVFDIATLNDQVVFLTRNFDTGSVRIYTFNSSGVQQSVMDVSSKTTGTFVRRLAVVSGTANGKNIAEFWLYGTDDAPNSSSVYRLSTQANLLGKYTLSGTALQWLGASTSGPLKIFAFAGSFNANGEVENLKTYAVPYPGNTSSSGSPFNSSTILRGTNAMHDVSRGDIDVLGDRILFSNRVRYTSPSGGTQYAYQIIDMSRMGESPLRTFSEPPAPSVEAEIIPLSEDGSLDAISIESHRGDSPNKFKVNLLRWHGNQLDVVVGLDWGDSSFFNKPLTGAVIPQDPGSQNLKVLVYNNSGLTAPSFGIITLPRSGNYAEFAGPFPISGLDPEPIFTRPAVARLNNQVIAYIAGENAKIYSVNLNNAITTPSSDTHLVASKLVDAQSGKDLQGAFQFRDLKVKNNLLYGYLEQGLVTQQNGDESVVLFGSLMTLDLANPSSPATYATMTDATIKAIPRDVFILRTWKVAMENLSGAAVPYVYSTLSDASIMELRTDARGGLNDLTYRLRPEGGIAKFGPAPSTWILGGDRYYASRYSAQLVSATTAQLKSSYVQSKTIPSEFLGAKQYLIPELKRGSNMRAGDFGDEIGVDPRRVRSGTSFVNCPGFEAKVLPSGNFVVEKTQPGRPPERVWSAITVKGGPVPGSFLDFDAGNGRIALLDPDGSVKWNAGTAGKGAMSLIMQRDGNLVAYDTRQKPAKAVWDSRGCLLGKCNAANALVPKVCE